MQPNQQLCGGEGLGKPVEKPPFELRHIIAVLIRQEQEKQERERRD
jgi:hypothetical protein